MSSSIGGSTPSVDESQTSKLKAKSNDPGWKYAYWPDPSDKNKVKCDLCGFVSNGGIKRQKQHLIGGFGDVAKCPKTTTAIATELYNHMIKNKKKKPMIDLQKETMLEEGETESDESAVQVTKSSSNVDLAKKRKAPQSRGPIDAFVRQNPEEEWVDAEIDIEDEDDSNEDEIDEEDDDNIDKRETACGDALAGASLDEDFGFGIKI